jgi:cyclomaltodextrinase / maltogenic alpha-amylase / neopullulanase
MKKILFTFIIFLSANSFCQEITDIIPLVKLSAGEGKTFLINDLFYSDKEYRIVFDTGNSLKVYYEAENGQLEITSLEHSEGYNVLPFYFYDKTFHILIKTDFKDTIFFNYKTHKPVNKVNLFGTFNSWNREELPMSDGDGDGIYSVGIPLEPGRYEYKFFVDGAEIFDSLNSEKVPNGMGDWNSIIDVKSSHKGKAFLHLLNFTDKDKTKYFTFYYETESEDSLEVFALLDNELFHHNTISNESRKIVLEIPSEKLNGTKTIRIAVNEKNRASNLQTILLKDGVPFTKQDSGWQDAIIYSLMIDRFLDGDTTNSIPVEHPELHSKTNYNGGDLQGIINKLEEGYFSSLGINTLWISPVIDNTPNAYQEYPEPHRYFTGYHGYWPVDPEKVEERFGDMNLLKKLIETAHEKGIKVLLDFVANHVHIEHPFWNEHRDWFGTLELPDGKKNLRLWDEQRLTTWFEPYMPSFDYVGSKEALEFMTDNAVWWLKETGADGFRHDAVKHVPNEFWRLLTKKIKEELEIPQGKKYYQIGETFGSYDLISSYVNNGQLSAQFNFNLFDVAVPAFVDEKSSFENLDKEINKTFSVYGVNNLMGNVIDSHDKVRFMAYADGDVALGSSDAIEIGWNNPPVVDNQLSYEKLKLYFTYMITIPGLPVVYYGDEFGMTGAQDPDNRRMMRFDDELRELEKETLRDVRTIINLRNQHSALRYGDFQTLFADKDIYAYLRSDFNERILVVLNKKSEERELNISLPDIYNLQKAINVIAENEIEVVNNIVDISVGAMSYLVLKLE